MEESADRWSRVLKVPCQLTVELDVSNFRLRDLASLRKGVVIDSRWSLGREVPVRANGLLLAWSQFEVSEGHLAVRLAEWI